MPVRLPPKEYLEASETSLIEEAAGSLRNKVMIRLLRRLGCRIGEVLGLEERNIDFVLRQVKIEHEKVRITLFCPYCKQNGDKTRLGKKHTYCPKCGQLVKEAISKATEERHLRKIPVDADTLKLIGTYIREGGITVVGGRRKLFNITRQRAWRIVVNCAEKAGFRQLINPGNEKLHHVSPHKFRDAFAINAMKLKPSMDDARLLQEMLGHSSIDTTMKYRKVKGAELQEFYDSIIDQTK